MNQQLLQKAWLWKLLSFALFFGAGNRGRIPISLAFPTFIDTFVGVRPNDVDGSFISAYAITVQPLIIGVVISAVSAWLPASAWDCGAMSNGPRWWSS